MARFLTRLLLSLLFLAAGTAHLLDPGPFLSIMPPFVPFHRECVLVSGILELAGGALLLAPADSWRRWAGCGLALLLIAVFPANIYMAVYQIRIDGFPVHPWVSWARLPLQPLLIAAVWWATYTPRTR
jgi:uncharacterized membrane protein